MPAYEEEKELRMSPRLGGIQGGRSVIKLILNLENKRR